MLESTSAIAVHVHALALAVGAAGICQAALLAGLCRWHWFFRIALVCVPLMMLLPVRAYEPLVLLFPVVLALAGSACLLRRHWEQDLLKDAASHGPVKSPPSRRWRISLRDSLLLMTVIGMTLGVLVQLPWKGLSLSQIGLLFDGLLLYLISLFCLGVIGLRGGLIWAALLFIGVSTGIVFESTWGDGLRALYLIGVNAPQHLHWPPLAEFYLVFATILLIGLWLVRWCWSAAGPHRLAQRSRLVGSLAMVVAAPAVMLYIAMFVGPAPVAAKKIRNNSLPQLVALAQQVEALNLGDMTVAEAQRTYPQTQLDRKLADLHRQSLQVVKQPGSVSLDGSLQANEYSLAAQESQLTLIRGLTRRWSREADYSTRQGDIRRAVDFDLAILRVGNYLARGGIRMHVQAAQAIKIEGLSHLSMLRDQLPVDLLPAIIDVLQLLDAGEEDPLQTLARDRYWTDLAQGWRNRLEIVVQRVLRVPNSEMVAFQQLQQPLAREAALRRLLGTELALRSYRQEKGEYPQSLAELVPMRLDELPRDPYTQQVLIYRTTRLTAEATRSGFSLYSTGPDAQDDGGTFARFGEHHHGNVDMNLESVMRFGWRSWGRRGPGGINRSGPRQPGSWATPPADGWRFDRREFVRQREEE